MLNKDRKEVIDAIIECFTDNEDVYENKYDALAKFRNKMNIKVFNKKPMAMQIKEWLNSEYVEKFRITLFEYELLQLYSRFNIYVERHVITKYQSVCFRMDGADEVILPSLISNTYFKFFNYGDDVTSVEMPVKEILEKCEVVDE